jgi:hypothetical protein
LNRETRFGHASGNLIPGETDAHRQDPVRSTHGLPSLDHLFSDRQPLWWRSQSAYPALHRTLSGHGFCATDLRESLRDWRIYADFAQRLIAQARRLYVDESLGLELTNTVYALDSTTIDLCLSVFPWASFRATKAAVKMHTLLDLRGPIPSFIHISDGKLHDVNVLVAIVRKRLELEISLYTMLQIFSVMPFEKITLQQALTINQRSSEQMDTDIQLNLFEF